MSANTAGPLTRLWRAREIVSWCLFDFANSSFTTVVVTVVFSVYFTARIAPDPETGQFFWNVGLVVSNLVILLTAPVVGAIADYSSRKKAFLFASYLACVGATAGLFLAGPGDVALAVSLFIVANTAFASGENLVAGFLPDLASPEDAGRVSAWGWAVGYVGGLLSLGLCLPLAQSGQDVQVRATNLVVAAFFLIGGLPTFIWVRERRRGNGGRSLTAHVAAGFRQTRDTLRHRAELPDLFRFLIAYLFYSIGIYGVIGHAGIYAKQLFKMTETEIIVLFIASQVTAGLGAWMSGSLTRRLGYVGTVRITLYIWILAAALGIASRTSTQFTGVALLAGFAMGSSLPASRAVVAVFAPPRQAGEIFGYWGLYARAAAILAPLGDAFLVHVTGRAGPGMVLYAASFVVGLVILGRVDEQRGLAFAHGGVTPSA